MMQFPSEGEWVAGRYRLDETIARGGMGVIFKAHEEKLGRDVAVKMVLPTLIHNEQAVLRFEREVKLAQSLHHRNIVEIMDFGCTKGGVLYVVMELLEGRDLSEMIGTDGPFDARTLRTFTTQILDALARAHAAGVVHRDIKASNIFIQRMASGEDVVKLLDFGVAKSIEDENPLTATGNVCGSTAYMAPETLLRGEVTLGVDVYALGLLMLEMMTARRAVPGSSIGQHVALHAHGVFEVPPPFQDTAVEDLIRRACDKDPDSRYTDARAMRAEIDAAFNGIADDAVVSRADARKFRIEIPGEVEDAEPVNSVPADSKAPTDAVVRHPPVTPSLMDAAAAEAEPEYDVFSGSGSDEALDATSSYEPDAYFDGGQAKIVDESGVETAHLDSKPAPRKVVKRPAEKLELAFDPRTPEHALEPEKKTYAGKIAAALLVICVVAAAAWFATNQPRWKSPQMVVDAMVADGWKSGGAVVDQDGLNETWRVTMLKGSQSVKLTMQLCEF